MSYNTTIKRFDILVDEANTTVTKTFELDKTIKSIQGILLTSDKDEILYYRGSQKIEINKEEIFPESFESKLLMSGINVAPNDRFYKIGNLPTGNGKIKIDFKDNNNSLVAFNSYKVSFYLIGNL